MGAEGHRHVKLTWSGLLRHEECSLQDKLYREGNRSKFADRRNFLQGTVVDLAMRELLEEGGGESLVDRTKRIFEQQIGDSSEGTIKWRGNPAEDRKLILNRVVRASERLEPWLYENILVDGVDYQPEARGTGTIGVPDGRGSQSRVDLFFATDILSRRVEAEKFTVWDLKVTENEQYTQGKTLAQLMFYAVGLAAHLQVPLAAFEKMAFVTPLLKNIEQPTFPDREDFRYLLTRIERYAQDRWAELAVPKDEADGDCRYRCDVKRLCPLFQVEPSVGGKVSLLGSAARRAGKAYEGSTEGGLDEF